jgi:peptidoglycan DL-endopeptidase CwlO
MTRRNIGRHRAHRHLPRPLSGTATVAASGLLVAVMGTTASATPQTPVSASPLNAKTGVSTAPAPFFDLSAQISEQASLVAQDKPVKAVAAKSGTELEYAALGFAGVEPEPVVEAEPVVEETDELTAEAPAQSATESRTEQAAPSRSETRAAAPAAESAPAAPAQPAAPAVASGAEGAISWALANTGLPYRVGSSSGGGYDCSGFTTAAFRAAGVSIPHGSQAQYHATSRVSLGSIQRGDLLFYSSNGSSSGIFHVAIYLGGGQVVHSLRDWSGGFSGSKVTGMHYSPGLMGAGRP